MSLTIVSIISEHYAGELVRPNGIKVYWKSLCLVWKIVFHLSSAAILITLCLFFKSNLVNHFLTLGLSTNLLISDRGYLLGIMRQFRTL